MRIQKVDDRYLIDVSKTMSIYMTDDELERLREYHKDFTEKGYRRIVKIGRKVILDEMCVFR